MTRVRHLVMCPSPVAPARLVAAVALCLCRVALEVSAVCCHCLVAPVMATRLWEVVCPSPLAVRLVRAVMVAPWMCRLE